MLKKTIKNYIKKNIPLDIDDLADISDKIWKFGCTPGEALEIIKELQTKEEISKAVIPKAEFSCQVILNL